MSDPLAVLGLTGIIDNDPKAPPHTLQPFNDIGLVEVVGHNVQSDGAILDGFVEETEYVIVCFESELFIYALAPIVLQVELLEFQPVFGLGRYDIWIIAELLPIGL